MTRADVQSLAAFRLMYGLLYPAVLGSGLVAFGQYILSSAPWYLALTSPRTYLIALLLVFYSASFVAAYRATKYGAAVIALDYLEVALVFAAFATMGMFPQSDRFSVWWTTGLVVAAVLLQMAWLRHAAADPPTSVSDNRALEWGTRAVFVLAIIAGAYVFESMPFVAIVCYVLDMAIVVAYTLSRPD